MSTYTPLASITLTSAQSSVTFSGYDMTYTDLVLVSSVTCATDSANQRMTVNGDSSSLYSTTRIAGNGSTATSGRYGGLAYFLLTGGAINPPSSASAQILITNFMNYSNTTTYKSILVRAGNASGSTYPGVEYNVELYRSTNAISSFTLSTDSANFNSGCTFSLYGIQAGTPKAQGGDIVTTDGTYWYHTFKSSGLFTPSSAISADYLVVAGGGGGGALIGGGGGAGGYKTSIGGSPLSLTAQAYACAVGAGGVRSAGSAAGSNGNNSVFSTITSTGGGGGGQYGASDAASGGSGGGGGAKTSPYAAGGSASPAGEGNDGAEGRSDGNYWAAGGGGGKGAAGSVGTVSASPVGGVGGNGTANSISGTSVTYAGGGGGGAFAGTGGSGGAGGSGGGGSGGYSQGNSAGQVASVAGTTNLGSGGGGGGYHGISASGSNGGSGIVIIRYAVQGEYKWLMQIQ